MKFNIVTNYETPPLEDHENLQLGELDTIPDSSCVSAILDGTFNYMTDDQIESLCLKIRHGGIISISSPDVLEISGALYHGRINLASFSDLTSQRLRQHSLMDAINIFQSRGYTIETASIKDFHFLLKVKRP